MSRKPDYQLSYLNKATENRGVVGAGWANDDGTISIRLNAMVHLFQDPNAVITLFPSDKPKKSKQTEEEDRTF